MDVPGSEEGPVAAPTEGDRDNARLRLAIAERQAEEYGQVLRWALGAFGPGWLPSHRHFLVDRDEEARVRYTAERPRAAKTVCTVKNSAGQARHFTVEDGRVVKHESMEAGFGALLTESHPTRGFEHQGKFVHVGRYSLCFAPYELYHPRSAEELAALRVSRERGRKEREIKKWIEENPLLAFGGIGPEC